MPQRRHREPPSRPFLFSIERGDCKPRAAIAIEGRARGGFIRILVSQVMRRSPKMDSDPIETDAEFLSLCRAAVRRALKICRVPPWKLHLHDVDVDTLAHDVFLRI